jgi:hypothetical protein
MTRRRRALGMPRVKGPTKITRTDPVTHQRVTHEERTDARAAAAVIRDTQRPDGWRPPP